MKKKSKIKESKCLLAVLKPYYSNDLHEDKNGVECIENLYKYAVELFEGISNNKEKSFSGEFDFSVQLRYDNFILYKKISGISANEKEYEQFLTAISILQMVFIDEGIFLSGQISESTLLTTKEILWGGISEMLTKEKSMIVVDENFAVSQKNLFTIKIGNFQILDFLPNVYRLDPFKEEEGNMMRHIATPILKLNQQQKEKIKMLIEYCRAYKNEKHFNFDL